MLTRRPQHGQVTGARDPAGPSGDEVGGIQVEHPGRVAKAVFEHDHPQLVRRALGAGTLPVEQDDPAVTRRADVVGPEVAVAGPDVRGHLESLLKSDKLGHQRGEVGGEGRVLRTQGLDELAPDLRADRLAVPGIHSSGSGRLDVVHAGEQPPDLARIKVTARLEDVDPFVDPDGRVGGRPTDVGQDVAREGAQDRGHRYARIANDVLVCRVPLRPLAEHRAEKGLHGIPTLIGDQAPDFALAAMGNWAFEAGVRAQPECAGDLPRRLRIQHRRPPGSLISVLPVSNSVTGHPQGTLDV